MDLNIVSFQDRKYEGLLRFWFGEIRYDRDYFEDRRRLWFSKSDSVDADIRIRFSPWLDELQENGLMSWRNSSRGLLALVILTDQIPRNVFRDSPRAYQFDSIAEAIALDLIATGQDLKYDLVERMFLYMPLEHSENEGYQVMSVEKFSALLKEAQPSVKPFFESALEYARRHREIIGRFGRFPHRNRSLNRSTTPLEKTFLNEPNSSF